MWFEIILDFVINLFPLVQETALDIMEWLTQPLPGLESLGLIYYPYEIMFGSALILIITWGAVSFILDIWPG